MKRFFSAFLIAALAAWPALAGQFRQLATARTRSGAAPKYDARRETFVEGTVASIITNPGPGMPVGAHLLLNTRSGVVDAHLGDYVLRGPNAVSLTPGESVKLVGVATTVQGHRVFLVRRLQTGLAVYQVRNEHGFLIRSSPPIWQGRRSAPPGGRS